MSKLVKHQFDCQLCGQHSVIITDVDVDPPSFCPFCGTDISDDIPQDDTDE